MTTVQPTGPNYNVKYSGKKKTWNKISQVKDDLVVASTPALLSALSLDAAAPTRFKVTWRRI